MEEGNLVSAQSTRSERTRGAPAIRSECVFKGKRKRSLGDRANDTARPW